MSETPISYADSGVNIDEAARALRAVAPLISRTHDSRVLGGIGGFGGLFDGSFTEDRPVLVSSIDGVGTKTKVAAMVGDYSNLGRDLVNHCINDILCQGAKPLFFMDYFGCSHLQGSVFEAVVGGAAEACFESGCALVGGETAEMPGVYHDDEIDIVGAIVGIVSQGMQIPKAGIEPNDAIIGIASSGLHTNGFSLARKVLFDIGGLSVRDEVPGLGTALGLELLRAHRCYFNSVYPLLQEVPEIMAIAHITGGGLYDNLPRVLGQDVRATIDRRSWTPLPVFELIERVGNVAWPEMYRTFNMGIGMALVVKRDVASAVVQRLSQAGEMASVIGEIERGPRDVQIV